MMEELRAWLLGVVFAAFSASLARELIPRGRERALVRMIGGLLLVLAILRPLGTIPWKNMEISVGNTQLQEEHYRTEQEKTLSVIIAQRLETYIWDKAVELGVNGTVRVTVVCRDGVPLPENVEIGAAYEPVLAAWIEEVVGIPAEKQIWLEESA